MYLFIIFAAAFFAEVSAVVAHGLHFFGESGRFHRADDENVADNSH